METEILIRKATPDDASLIATIHVSSWQATYRGHMNGAYLDSLSVGSRAEMWNRMLVSEDTRVDVHVAESGDEVVGFCSWSPARDDDLSVKTADLCTIYVQPGRTRSGIGAALITHAEEGMRAAGYRTAILWVLKENASARAFYDRAGWSFDGMEKEETLWGQWITEVRYFRKLDR